MKRRRTVSLSESAIARGEQIAAEAGTTLSAVIARKSENHTVIVRLDDGTEIDLPWMFCIAGHFYEAHTGQLIDAENPRLPEIQVAVDKYWKEFYRRKNFKRG